MPLPSLLIDSRNLAGRTQALPRNGFAIEKARFSSKSAKQFVQITIYSSASPGN